MLQLVCRGSRIPQFCWKGHKRMYVSLCFSHTQGTLQKAICIANLRVNFGMSGDIV